MESGSFTVGIPTQAASKPPNPWALAVQLVLPMHVLFQICANIKFTFTCILG